MIETTENTVGTNQSTMTPYDKQRKHLAIAFFVCGVFLIGFIVFAFISLPKYKSNQDVVHLSKAYAAIRDIDYYINLQGQGGQLNNDFLKEKIDSATTNLNRLTDDAQADAVKMIWGEFQQQIVKQNRTFSDINAALLLKRRVESTSLTLYQTLTTVSHQLSEGRSVSVETIRYIDQLANSVIKLNANILRIVNSQSNIEIKLISELTDSLTTVQKGLNSLMIGIPTEGVQSIKGLLEEESIIESQFIFNQLAKDVTDLIQDASGIVALNQIKVRLQEEKDKIQMLLQSTIDRAYTAQQHYIEVTNQSVFLISLLASVGTIMFFLIFSLLFLRLNKSRLSIASEKYVKEQRIDEVMNVIEKFIVLRDRLLPQLEIVASLNNESDNVLHKGREVKSASSSFNQLIKDMEYTYECLEQAFSHDLALLKVENCANSLVELRVTLKKQMKFFIERKHDLINMKQCSILMDDFFSSVISNTNESVMAYREVEKELMLIISEIDQLHRDLKE